MTMSLSRWWLVALAIPLFGLGALWATAHVRSTQGSDWDVPIMGYDPRDLLRGHYVEYRYDWPGLRDEQRDSFYDESLGLCIKGNAPRVASVSVVNVADASRQTDCAAVVRANMWAEEGVNGVITDRIYIPQTRGREYEDRLRDPDQIGIVRVRIRPDGHITPLSLTFRARLASERPEPLDSQAVEATP